MLKIVVIANTYREGIDFIKYKFQNKIESINTANAIYTLKNGDEIHLSHSESHRYKYKGMEYDAFILTPSYETLFDIIRRRSEIK